MTTIKGYTPLSDGQKADMNELKETEERLLRFLDDLSNADPRWIAIAKTDLQKAFMAANRAIAQPQRIALPEDPPPETENLK